MWLTEIELVLINGHRKIIWRKLSKRSAIFRNHDVLNYEEFQNHKVIQKHSEVYRACRDVIRAEKDAPDRLLYRKQHRAESQLHETTLKELAEFGIHKLPSAEKLQRQQIELEEEQVPPFLIHPSQALQKPIFCSMIRTIFTWCPFASVPFFNCSHKICEFPFFLGELEIINISIIF